MTDQYTANKYNTETVQKIPQLIKVNKFFSISNTVYKIK